MIETAMASKAKGSAEIDRSCLHSDLEMIEKRSQRIANVALEAYNDASPDHKNLLILGLFREARSLASGALLSAQGMELSEHHAEPTQYNLQKLIRIARTIEMLTGYPEGFFEKQS